MTLKRRAKAELAAGERPPRVTPKNTKRTLAVAKLVAPLLAPIAFQGASAVRDRWDRERARRLGIPVERLAEFTGRGAALHVRLSGLATAIGELRTRHPADDTFAAGADRRLGDLSGAVRAAEQMPAARRRAAHRVVGAELDALEQGLLTRLGV